jgi:thiopeptide-type bacteriocin biosynthesis protein
MEQRIFIPGDQWLYYKIYTGEVIADKILTEIIGDIARKFVADNIIDQWFFIRYHDDLGFHLRIRFRFIRPENQIYILNLMKEQLTGLVNEKIIWKIQLDTYQRELERYDLSAYHKTEKIFYTDSCFVINLLKKNQEIETDELWLYALKSMDDWLEITGYTSISEKLKIIKPFADMYANEFKMDKKSRRQINDKYKQHQPAINYFLSKTTGENNNDIFGLLSKRKADIKQILQGERISETALSGFIHMTINRIFQHENRKYEWVLYQFLFLYYRQKAAFEKYQKDKPTTKPE